MTQKETQIFEFMKEYAVEAGRMLMLCRGKVADVGKVSGDLIKGKYSRQGLAKTVVDEIIQELFLQRLHKQHPEVRINVEEETPSKHLFWGSTSDCTVHQDPCDGTDSYVQGYDEFTTGYGISD